MSEPAASTQYSQLTLLQCILLVLSIYVLAALFIQAVFPLSPETNVLIDRIDFFICLIFIFDFFLRLYRAKSRLSFLKWGWIELVSSIPMIEALRWGRLVRVVRILRILRAFRSTKVLLHLGGHSKAATYGRFSSDHRGLHYLFRNRANGTFATVVLFSMVMVIFSSIAILNLETKPESNIKTASDALWWSFVTITTVGYGDKFPVTHEGRVMAAFLMTAGVGLFGTFTGYIATFFMEAEQEKEEGEIQQLIEQVKLLRDKIDLLEKGGK